MNRLTNDLTLVQLADIASAHSEYDAALALLQLMASDMDGRKTHWACSNDVTAADLILSALLARKVGAFSLFVNKGGRYPHGLSFLDVRRISSTVDEILSDVKAGKGVSGWSFHSLFSGIGHNETSDVLLNMRLLAGIPVSRYFVRGVRQCAESGYSEDEENFPGSADAIQKSKARLRIVDAVADYISNNKWLHASCWRLRSDATI